MANPYPAEFTDEAGEARLTGFVDFTDPGNAPSTPGAAIVRKFAFAFDTAGLAAGVALYTPTADDVLLDMWVSVVTAWDGTTPQGDVATAAGDTHGFWSNQTGESLKMDAADNVGAVLGTGGNQLSDARTATASGQGTSNDGQGLYVVSGAAVNYVTTPVANGIRQIPVTLTGDPVLFWVSQDGFKGGADPGSSAGAAILYLVTATPA